MKRKVVQQGAATLMVSLPSEWARKVKVKKGDEVDINEVEGNLLVSKGYSGKKRKTKVVLKEDTESAVRTAIVNAYRSGFNVIELHYFEKEVFSIVLDTLQNYLIGFDVISREGLSCVIENITEPSGDQFDVFMKKIFINIEMLLDGTYDRLKTGAKFSEYKQLTLMVHKYDNFCRRLIAKNNTFGSKSKLFWTFLGILIHGQRELYHLNRYLDKNKVAFKQFKVVDDLKKLFGALKEAYLEKDVSKVERVHTLEKQIVYKKVYTSLEGRGKDNIVLFHLGMSAKHFYLASSPLLGLLL
jgi:hypothetical protein